MKTRLQPIEVDVPECDPFQKDLLDRKNLATTLTQLVDAIEGPCVMAIDAPWGAGKTTFLKMWSQQLRNKGFPVVDFNAWETDHAEDPFVALVSEVQDRLKDFDDESLNKRIIETAEAAKHVALRAIPGIIRLVTAGVPDVALPIAKEAGKLLASYAERRLDQYEKDQKSLDTFREKLHAMANALHQSKNHPLVILIDELDRCRPPYAIALLEIAKHLFGTDHVIFVLAVNRSQLAYSVCALYGSDFDAIGYLRRFFDIDFTLPEPDRTQFIQDLLQRVGVKNVKNGNDQFVLLAKAFGSSTLSLRQVNQAIHRIGLVARSLRTVRAWITTSAAVVIRTIDIDLYRRFSDGALSDLKLVNAIHQKVNIRHAQLEAIIIMAAKEIDCRNRNVVYEEANPTPLMAQYQEQSKTSGHARTVINYLKDYEKADLFSMSRNGLGFVEAARRVDLLEGVMDGS